MSLKEEFENYLLDNLPKSESFHPTFQKALQEMLKAGGKRFRPLLLLTVVEAYQPLLIPNAFAPALALEALHTYSLIHDDLPAMDDADLRRGHPTLHKTYDEVTAILVGDALNTYAFNILSNAPLNSDIVVKLVRTLSSDGGIDGMIIGQAIDCHFENQKLGVYQVEFLHIHKTAKLIAASLKMGAIIADLDESVQEQLYRFGIDLGLLFQVQDDIIDETSTSSEAGKTVGNDGDKNSFINLMGLDDSIDYANVLAKKCEDMLSKLDPKLYDSLNKLLSKYFYRHNI
jgi:farnesyl diphosphate synthase